MKIRDLRIYSLDEGMALGQSVASALGVQLSPHEERRFEDGEHKIRPLQDGENCDACIVQSLYAERGSSVNDKLVRVLFFAAALRDAGARRVYMLAPYICYARKDRRTKPHDPVSLRYVAQLFESVGIAGIAAMDVHNEAAFDNAFRCRSIRISAGQLFANHVAAAFSDKPLTVASPDLGGAKRADAFRQMLQTRLDRSVGTAFMEKHRSAGIISGDLVAGDIAGRCVLVLDDLIAGGATVCRAARAFVKAGAAEVHAFATHGVFGEGAERHLALPDLQSVVITNSIDARPPGSELANKLVTLDIAPLVAECARQLSGRASSDA